MDCTGCDTLCFRSLSQRKMDCNAAGKMENPAAPVSATSRTAERERKRQLGIRPNKGSYEEIPLLTPGKLVRVKVKAGWRRAMIDCCNDDDGTVDVSFLGLPDILAESRVENATSPAEASVDEATVCASDVRPLEEFETNEQPSAFNVNLYETAATTKENANVLFKLGDIEAAIEHYTRAIDELKCVGTSGLCGEDTVLLNRGGKLIAACLHDIDRNKQTAKVSVDGGADTISSAPWRVLIQVHGAHLQLQSSLFMNRARGLAQLGHQQDAAQDLTVAIALWTASDEAGANISVNERKEQLTKCFCLRARTRLARMRVEPARTDITAAWALQPSDASSKLLRQLETEADAAQREQTRSNRHLAKEIAKFADGVMTGLSSAQIEALGQAGSVQAQAGSVQT